MRIELRRVQRAVMPKLQPNADTLDEAGRVVIGGIIDNVLKSKRADGGPVLQKALLGFDAFQRGKQIGRAMKKAGNLAKNSRDWRDRKSAAGLGTRSLIAAGQRLVQGSSNAIDALMSDAPVTDVRGASYVIDVDEQRGVVKVRPSDQEMLAPARPPATFKASSASPKDLARWVQEMGYTGWLGISEKAARALRAVFRRHIARVIKQAREESRKSREAAARGPDATL